MIEDLKKLKAGQTIHCPVYDYGIHNRTDKTVEVRPTKVVIIEGILIFQNPDLRDLLDIKIFVEPTRKFADIVVLEGGNNLVALDLIMQRIAHHIAQS